MICWMATKLSVAQVKMWPCIEVVETKQSLQVVDTRLELYLVLNREFDNCKQAIKQSSEWTNTNDNAYAKSKVGYQSNNFKMFPPSVTSCCNWITNVRIFFIPLICNSWIGLTQISIIIFFVYFNHKVIFCKTYMHQFIHNATYIYKFMMIVIEKIDPKYIVWVVMYHNNFKRSNELT